MSEFAQLEGRGASSPEGPSARASLLFGALARFAKETPGKLPSITPHLSPQFRGGNGEALVSVDSYLEGLARLERSASEPAFVVRAGLSQELTELGLLGHACAYSENLWDALQMARDGVNYLQDGSTVSLGMRLNRCRIDYSNDYGSDAEAAYDIQSSMALLINLIRQARGYRGANLFVRFPRCTAEHRHLLPDAQLVSSASRGTIEFDSFLLRRPMIRSDPELAATVAKTMAAWVDHEPPTAKLISHLQKVAIQEMHRPLSLSTVSRLLSKPTRSLQFELRTGKTSFAWIRDEARHEAAKLDLSAGRSVVETAHRLGYAQHQSFSEAFSRWEGIAPSVYASRGR